MKRALTITVALTALAAPARAEEAIDSTLVETSLAPPSAPPPLDIPYLQYGVASQPSSWRAPDRCARTPSRAFSDRAAASSRASAARWAGRWTSAARTSCRSRTRGASIASRRCSRRAPSCAGTTQTGLDTQPFATAGAGAVAYGNEWSVDTYGPTAFLGIGVESQLSRRTVVGLSLAYASWGSASSSIRAGSIARRAWRKCSGST